MANAEKKMEGCDQTRECSKSDQQGADVFEEPGSQERVTPVTRMKARWIAHVSVGPGRRILKQARERAFESRCKC